MFYLRTLNPFGDRQLKINCQAIGEVLDIHRTSVSRALKKLEQVNLIELEITSAQVKLKTSNRDAEPDPRNDANQDIDKDSDNSVHPRTESIPETLPDKDPRTPQTLQTYTDFKKTLSEGERENFLNFVKEETKNLERPINDLEAWLASKNAAKQNRWEIYYKNYQEEKISESARTNKQKPGSGNYSPEQMQRAIAEFQKRMQINQPVDEPEPEDLNSEETRQRQAEFNKLLGNSPKREKSLAQQYREALAQEQQQQQEINCARKKAAEEFAEQLNPDLEQRRLEILQQIEQLKQSSQKPHPEDNR